MDGMDSYRPELLLLSDAYMGSPENFAKKLQFLARFAQPEQWSYTSAGTEQNQILKNYLFYTYDRVKQEGKVSVSEDGALMCFNTGLQTVNGNDIYALFEKNTSPYARPGQDWYLNGFKQRTDKEMQLFSELPDIADYFTNPADFIFDKKMEIYIDYDHIIDDNFDRFVEIGLSDKFIIHALLESAIRKIVEKTKRNYKLAIPQFYTDKGTGVSKIQLLLPLFLRGKEEADLALVVDKSNHNYIGKTILTIDWAYVNSRRIVKPNADWLKI